MRLFILELKSIIKKKPWGHKNWRGLPLQKVASDILDLEYKEIRPKVSVADIEIPYKNYVCISEFTSSKKKEWIYPNGWQIIVDHLNDKGIQVIVCSEESTKLKNIIDRTGDFPLKNRAKLLQNANFFIGCSSGLSWLSYTVETPVIMISGTTEKYHEFSCHRVINEDVCHGCITDPDIEYHKSECPKHKGTEREFECNKEIMPEMVIEEIEKLL